jgi:hypothetical protein
LPATAVSLFGLCSLASAQTVAVKVGDQVLAVDPFSAAIDNPNADIIVDGGVHYVAAGHDFITQVRSVQLLHGATIVLGTSKAIVAVSNFVSQGGSIISFDPPHKTAAVGSAGSAAGSPGAGGANGLDGGSLSLFADQLDTQGGPPLIIDLSGQDGGPGGAGAQGQQGATGSPGSDGVALPSPDAETRLRQWQCITPPGDAGTGGIGGIGGAGGLGAVGGHGGAIVVVLGQASDASRVKAISEGGHGGFGGAGGLPGAEGEPGRRAGNVAGLCGVGKPGHEGAPGKPGLDRSHDQAAAGHDGIVLIRSK